MTIEFKRQVSNHQKTKSDAKVLRRPQTKTENEHNFCTFSKITRQYLCEDRKIVKKAAKLSTNVCRKQNWLTCRKVVYWKLSPSTVLCHPPPPTPPVQSGLAVVRCCGGTIWRRRIFTVVKKITVIYTFSIHMNFSFSSSIAKLTRLPDGIKQRSEL